MESPSCDITRNDMGVFAVVCCSVLVCCKSPIFLFPVDMRSFITAETIGNESFAISDRYSHVAARQYLRKHLQ